MQEHRGTPVICRAAGRTASFQSHGLLSGALKSGIIYADGQAGVNGKVAPGENKFYKTNVSHEQIGLWGVAQVRAVSNFLLFPRLCMN